MMACSKNEDISLLDTLSSLYIFRIVSTINKTTSFCSYSSSKKKLKNKKEMFKTEYEQFNHISVHYFY